MSIYTGVLERLAGGATSASAATFAALSSLRRKRFFHPDGDVYEGKATFIPTSIELPFSGVTPAEVRLSRGAGMPGSLPDVFGLAVRFSEYGQDVLLATSGESTVTRHFLLPATGFFSLPYSSILPYELGENLIVFGARADADLKNVATPEEIDPLVAVGRLRFDLTVVRVGGNEPETFASLVVDARHEGDIKFNPWNCHPSLRPAGPLNRLRRETYQASQAARPE